ncbi:MAG: aldo/keto reductase [Solobacterium sp.]|nr:aldo/keto reductase [Solobacterium sp.]
MKYTKLGNSDLTVSRICLGCMGFGVAEAGMHKWTLDYDSSKEIIQYALDKGITFFDTAMAYQSGTSEEFVGRAIRESGKRDEVVIATKYSPVQKQMVEEGKGGRQYIETCLNNSLSRLGTDHIDLYIMHSWDYLTPVLETLETLNDAIKAGKIRAIGISNCYSWQLAKANALAEAKGLTKFVSIQSHYNLLAREDERELVKYCKEDNIAMTPYSALAAGRLSKKPGETSKRLELDAFAKGKYDATAEADQKVIERVLEISEKKGVSMTEVSLAWLLTKVTSPVVGATKPHHIDGAVNAVDLALTEEEIKYLEEPYIPHALVGVLGQSTWIKQAE